MLCCTTLQILFYKFGYLLESGGSGNVGQFEQDRFGTGHQSAFTHGTLDTGFLVAGLAGGNAVFHQIDVVALGQKIDNALQNTDMSFRTADNDVLSVHSGKGGFYGIGTHDTKGDFIVGFIVFTQTVPDFLDGGAKALGVLLGQNDGDVQNLKTGEQNAGTLQQGLHIMDGGEQFLLIVNYQNCGILRGDSHGKILRFSL